MNYSFIIRKASVEDAKAIQCICREAFEKYSRDAMIPFKISALNETVEDIISDIHTKEVFVAFIDDVPVGSVRIEVLDSENAYLSRFAVSLEHHNIGIGKSLINIVDKFLKAQKIKRVKLHTASRHADLIRFYYSRGFYVESTSVESGYIRALMVKEY